MHVYRKKTTGQEVSSPTPLEHLERLARWEKVAGPDLPVDQSDSPPRSATRGEWDEYATSVGVDPAEYASKDDLMAAFEKEE